MLRHAVGGMRSAANIHDGDDKHGADERRSSERG
jgi:hypothetical protein